MEKCNSNSKDDYLIENIPYSEELLNTLMASVARSRAICPPATVYRRSGIACGIKVNKKKQKETTTRGYFIVTLPKQKLLSSITTLSKQNLWNNIGSLQYPHEMLIQNRYPIIDIIFCESITAIRTTNGLAALYDTRTLKFICFINHKANEIIRSIFFNRDRKDLVKVSMFAEDQYSRLRTYTASIENLSHNIINFEERFEDIICVHPGFIEFDTVNSRFVIFPGKETNYRVGSLIDYNFLFQVSSINVGDVKMTPDALLIICLLSPFKATARFADINTGKIGGGVVLHIDPNEDVEFVERCDLFVLVKQHHMDAISHDVTTKTSRALPGTAECASQDFIFLYSAKLIVLYRRSGVFEVYGWDGQKRFNIMAARRLQQAPICASTHQKYFVAVSSAPSGQSIHTFKLSDGREVFCGDIGVESSGGFLLSSIAFDDSTNCIVCGDEVGTVQFWM